MAKAAEERYDDLPRDDRGRARRARLGRARRACRRADRRDRRPAGAPPPPRSNLPHFDTPLVGRDEELAAVLALLHQASARLITLTGLGGTGKSRLALEAATTLRDEYDAAYFVDLAPVQDPQLVASAIAGVLGVRDSPDRPLVEAIAERLADTTTLLVLDEFEQVLPAAATIAELLAAAPGLKILTTCRTQLRLRGEREFPVPPLGVPGRGAAAADSPAVQLFVERAQEAKPSFELTDDNLEAVAEICRRLEGIPLAIELAAARVKLLTPEQIVGRLAEKRLSFLTGGSQQDSLRDAIEWSFNLLDDRGKALFAHMAVFVGGASLETAETVAGQPLGLEFGEVLDGIAGLVDNGLVRQGESADGEPRFRMLETIREYALEKLAESGDLATVQTRHLERYVALAETAEPELTRAGQAAWLERLSEENDNIRAALAWSFESGQVELGLRLAGSLVRFWSIRGLMTEGRRWLTKALESASGVTSAVLGKAYFAAGYAALGQGDYAQATPFFEESLRLAREAGDVRLEAQAEQQLGWLDDGPRLVRRGRGLRGQGARPGARDRRQARAVRVPQHPRRDRGREGRRRGRERALRAEPRPAPRARRQAADRELGAHARPRGAHARRHRARDLAAPGGLRARAGAERHLERLARADEPRPRRAAERRPARGREALRRRARAREGTGRQARRGRVPPGPRRGGVGAGRAPRRRRTCSARARRCSRRSARRRPPIEVTIGEQFAPPLKASLGEERFAAEWAAGRAIPADDAIELGLRSASDPDLVAAPA